MLGLRFCAGAFSSCGERGPLFITVRGPLTIVASLVAEHRLQTRRLSSCGSWAQPLHGMWDPPRPGLEPVSPASAGRFSTTAPPGKPLVYFKIASILSSQANEDYASELLCQSWALTTNTLKWLYPSGNQFATAIKSQIHIICMATFINILVPKRT